MEQMIANRTKERRNEQMNVRMFASKMMKQILTNITTRQILANKTNQKLVKYDRANQKSREKKALKTERTIAAKKRNKCVPK